MDRFRFRAWRKSENMYYYDAECTYDYMCGTPPIMATTFDELLFDDDYVIEQCTGLRDKNGKLIYEGDVVRLTYFDYNGKDYCMVGVIKYEMFGLMIKGVKGEHFEDFTGYEECEGKMYLTCWLGEFDFDPDYDFEVIGNIHEMEVKDEQ